MKPAGAPVFRIMGVDTALRKTGVGAVAVQGSAFRLLGYETVVNPARRSHTACLGHLFTEISACLVRYQPEAVAVEGIFYCKNVRTAVILGQARGVVLAACDRAGVPVFEYPARRVKKAVVGVGSAHKQQVIQMMRSLLGLEATPTDDEADALALSICHAQFRTGPEPPQAI